MSDDIQVGENEVLIPFDAVLWNIKPVVRESEGDGILVELQWGWTAGMFEEDLKNIADDAPTGHDSVTTNLDMIEELRDELNVIIEKYKARHTELRAEAERRMNERFPDLDKMLRKHFPLEGDTTS
jgi:hypothetical protein